MRLRKDNRLGNAAHQCCQMVVT